MTKDRWQVVKNLQEVPMDVWFDYYKENGGKSDDMVAFEVAFSNMVMGRGIVENSKGHIVYINFNTALSRLYEFYNNKFSE